MNATPAARRRNALVRWIAERKEHDGLTAAEIVDVSGIYTGHGREDRCFDDLKVLARRGLVERDRKRPARWYAWGPGWRI